MKILFDPDATGQAAGGGTGASSTSADANPPEGASSTPAIDANKDFADLAVAALEKEHPPTSETPPASSAGKDGQSAKADGDVGKTNKTPEGEQTPPAAQQVPPAKGEFEDLPFHKHERFVAIVKERNDFKSVVEKAKPQLERLDGLDSFCNQNGITAQQFQNVMEITALINTNPTEALKRLQPTLEHLQKHEGQVLPPELQAEVDSGKLPLEYAQRIVKAESGRQFVQQRSQQTEQQQREQMLTQALTNWETLVSKADTEYAKKRSFVNDRFVRLTAGNPWQTPQQVVALAQQAYDEVNEIVKGYAPPVAPIKVLSNNGGGRGAGKEPSTPEDWDNIEEQMVAKFAGARR